MPRQEVEFEFPDPDKESAASVEVNPIEDKDDLQVDKAVNDTPVDKKAPDSVKTIKKGELEIDIVDDRPPEDRGIPRAKKPEPVSDDELAAYDDKVKKRLADLQRGYDDERRAKETARRQREELERFSKQLMEENQQLKQNSDQSHNILIEQAKQQVQLELNAAKKQYKEAYDAGDSDALLAAQEALTTAKIRADKVAALKPKSLQAVEKPVQQPQMEPASPPQQPARDQKAEAWKAENEWFGTNVEMTAAALGYHHRLVNDGVDARSDEYYDKVNAYMRNKFPEGFSNADQPAEESPQPAKKPASNVVAPATRSTSPKKITLTHTQVAIAKRLGVPLTEYAQQVAKLQRK